MQELDDCSNSLLPYPEISDNVTISQVCQIYFDELYLFYFDHPGNEEVFSYDRLFWILIQPTSLQLLFLYSFFSFSFFFFFFFFFFRILLLILIPILPLLLHLNVIWFYCTPRDVSILPYFPTSPQNIISFLLGAFQQNLQRNIYIYRHHRFLDNNKHCSLSIRWWRFRSLWAAIRVRWQYVSKFVLEWTG